MHEKCVEYEHWHTKFYSRVHLAAGSTAAKIVYAITVIIEILRILVANCMCSWVPRVRLRIRASRVLHVWLREFFLVKTAVTSTN